MPRWTILVLVASFAGCSPSRPLVRLDTGQGEPRLHVPRRDGEPVEVSLEEFKQATVEHAPSVPAVQRPLEYAGRLFGVPERSGWFWYEGRSQRLMASEPDSHPNVKVLAAMKGELSHVVSPQAVVATVVGGLTMYAVLLALPEPVTKGVAALLTLGAMAYLGWDTVWRLMDGWLVLMKEVDRATTFDGIYASGEKFGDVMGEKAARAFVMLATVAMGNTVAGIAAALPKLPGAGQAAVVAATQLNIRFTAPALAQVESVSLSAEGVTIALAPNAVAMAARDSSGGKAGAQAAPPNSGGPGEWVQVGEYMPEQSRRYQAQVTGAPEGTAYRVKWGEKDVDFDGFDQGVLLEAKGTGYAQWVDKDLNFLRIFKGRDQMLDQAQRQFRAARGTPIRWIVAEEKLAGALRKLFKDNFLGDIEVVHIPPRPPAP